MAGNSRHIIAISLFLLISSVIMAEEKISLDKNWKFHYGSAGQAWANDFDDSEWETVNLPHDWSIGPMRTTENDSHFPFSEYSPGGKATGYTSEGEAWYRKKLVTDNNHKKYSLFFEGVYMQAEVWVNGHKIACHYNGYTPFICDISPYCFANEKENCIAVKVINDGKNSRWYSGSGIYRHVWLITSEKIHFDYWGPSVSTIINKDGSAEIDLSYDILNESGTNNTGIIITALRAPSGERIATQKDKWSATKGSRCSLKQVMKIDKPCLWSIENPLLYKITYSLSAVDGTADSNDIKTGLRSISFSAEKGFSINGKSVKLKGGCIHHDNGLLGVAAFDRAEKRKVEILKSNGFNAVRCAHNPPSEAFLNACDELGILVIDEAFDQWQKAKNPDDYHIFFDSCYEKDLTAMILHDRNHPSVIMWSIGNEIMERADSSGIKIAEKLVDIIHRYDSTRPVTAAVNAFWDNPGKSWSDSEKAFRLLDVAGYNYMWYEYENDHALFPERIIYGSESVARDAAITWNKVMSNSYIIGDFVWSAIDYLGEAGIGHSVYSPAGEEDPQFMSWPWFNAWCGDIDICGEKKPQSYFRDIVWGERQIAIFVRPPVPSGFKENISYWGWPDEQQSWNRANYEGDSMRVNVYSKPGEISLYLNNTKIGNKIITPADNYTASFVVPYSPGTLTARRDDDVNAVAGLKTTGRAFKLKLISDTDTISSLYSSLAYVTIEAVDSTGNLVPDSDLKIHISVSGTGKIIGAGNACPTDMQSFRSVNPKLYRGKALVIIQSDEIKGTINLSVSANDMQEKQISIITN